MPLEKKQLSMKDVQKFDPSPLYLYTAKDALNRVTVLKEANRDAYLIAGRYSGSDKDHRLYTPLNEEDAKEIEKLVRMGRKDATITFL
jgi:hypothetical protein